MKLRSLIVIPALLPASAAICYVFFSHLSLPWFITMTAAFPVLVAGVGAVEPELVLASLLPYLAIYQALYFATCKVRGLFVPPDLSYVAKGKVKKVAVIGAGSAGITAAKEAMEAGLEVVVFEQTSAIGGNWVFREEDAHSSVYRSTVINTTKQLMSYSDYPMPEETPAYPHHTDIVKYFNSYVDHFGVRGKIRFNTRVHDVSLIDGDRWQVVSSSTDSSDVGKPEKEHAQIREDGQSAVQCGGEQTTEEYDAVMVCNGHHHVPMWPDFPGQDSFKGHVIHSHSYKDPTTCDRGFDYRGKRVLVVGVGNSGVDVAVELSRVTEKLYLSTRSGTWVMPKYVNGVALDHAWTLKRGVNICLPDTFQKTMFFNWLFADAFEQKIHNVQGCMKAWGMRPKYRVNQAHATVNQDLLHRIGLGSIAMKGNVQEVTEDGVVFVDGSKAQLDAIVFSTGYLIRFPFLAKSLAPVNEENHVRLHHFMLNPRHPPTLVHVGLIQPIGAIMPISELQSRWAIQIFKGDRGVPKPKDMERLITERLDALWRVFVRRARHTTESQYFPIVEALAEEIGCVPRVWNPNNWKVLKELLATPAGWPFTYRLQGPGSWDGAAGALKTAYHQIGHHP